MKKSTSKQGELITRKEALEKLKKHGKYTALTALGTYMLLNPQKAQSQSPEPPGF